MTIDDYPEAMTLMRKMAASLPIPARPSKALVRLWRKELGRKVDTLQRVQVEEVHYLGDEGGILCKLDLGSREEAFVVSLTHLNVQNRHPLASEIRAYQKKRKQRLAAQDLLEGPGWSS